MCSFDAVEFWVTQFKWLFQKCVTDQSLRPLEPEWYTKGASVGFSKDEPRVNVSVVLSRAGSLCESDTNFVGFRLRQRCSDFIPERLRSSK